MNRCCIAVRSGRSPTWAISSIASCGTKRPQRQPMEAGVEARAGLNWLLELVTGYLNPRDALLTARDVPAVRLPITSSSTVTSNYAVAATSVPLILVLPEHIPNQRESSVDSEVDRPAPAIEGVARSSELSPVPGWVGIVRVAAAAAAASD